MEWTTSNPPPEGHKDVGPFCWKLFEDAVRAKEREFLFDRLLKSYNLYRRQRRANTTKGKSLVIMNLFFANVERTVANIVSKRPVFTIVDFDGDKHDIARLSTNAAIEWWKKTNQQSSLTKSATNMEIYGTTIEKACWNSDKKEPEFVIVDPFSAFPAPGAYDDIGADPPYFHHAYPEDIPVIRAAFDVPDDVEISTSDLYSLFGEERVDFKPLAGGNKPQVNTNTNSGYGVERRTEYRTPRGLVVETWLRDYSKEKIEVEVALGKDENGDPIIGTQIVEQEKYPGGIRVVTTTNDGQLVLSDMGNPSINDALPKDIQKKSYLYNRFPFKHARSYVDPVSTWGFSGIEQVGDINNAINRIISRMTAYCERAMYPPLVVPKNCGVATSKLSNKPNLIIRPDNIEACNAIRFVNVPNLPSSFINVFNMLVGMHDRIYQIEDADRGAAPGNVIAASAIMALQERNNVLIQKKITSVEDLIVFRGSCYLSFKQNYGLNTELVSMDDEPWEFRGLDIAGLSFGFVVEPGSTTPRTQAQAREEAKEAFKLGIIDRQAYLELTNFPNYKAILERVSEGQLGQAIQILIQAGLDEKTARGLYEYLQQQQFGKGEEEKTVAEGQPQAMRGGVPKAQQGGQQ